MELLLVLSDITEAEREYLDIHPPVRSAHVCSTVRTAPVSGLHTYNLGVSVAVCHHVMYVVPGTA